MNKKSIVAVIAIIVLIAGAIGYVATAPKTKMAAPTTNAQAEATQKDDATNAQSDPLPAGSYKDYTEDAVTSTNGTKLLFFHAPWCPQCRALEASIKKDGLPHGVTVFKVDYDTNQDLRRNYGVTIQTTLVKIDDSGNKIASYVAYDEPVFSAVERELLP